jgi:hypothetical protein
MRRTPALVRLEKKLDVDPCAILNATEIRLLEREVQRVLVSSFPDLQAQILDHSEEAIRWHALGARCAEGHGARGIRDVSVSLGIPQYRLRAIEGGRLKEFRANLARRYFHFLAIDSGWRTGAARIGSWQPTSVSWTADGVTGGYGGLASANPHFSVSAS